MTQPMALLSEAQIDRKREWNRNHYSNNKDKYRESCLKSYYKNKEKFNRKTNARNEWRYYIDPYFRETRLERAKLYNIINKDKLASYGKQYYQEHKTVLNQKKRMKRELAKVFQLQSKIEYPVYYKNPTYYYSHYRRTDGQIPPIDE